MNIRILLFLLFSVTTAHPSQYVQPVKRFFRQFSSWYQKDTKHKQIVDQTVKKQDSFFKAGNGRDSFSLGSKLTSGVSFHASKLLDRLQHINNTNNKNNDGRHSWHEQSSYARFNYKPFYGLSALGISSYVLWAQDDKQNDKVFADELFKQKIKELTRDHNKMMAQVVKIYPELAKLYAMPAAQGENHTLKEHTLNVFKRFATYKDHFDFDQIKVGHITSDIDTLLHALILLHDIGKPLGKRQEQHQRTVVIARPMLEKWGFTHKEINLAITLIDNDVIGEMVQPQFGVSVYDAHAKLTALAEKAGLDLKTYYLLQVLFYLSDASSYPFIRNYYMDKLKTDFLIPTHYAFTELYNWIMYDRKPQLMRLKDHSINVDSRLVEK